ncbi:hypothetical protein AJ80_03105 [Polytolypa hystricis UAMH7299]|uniref:Fe2OG dioxygenase domain-containing protein n=1 Tax=Polytolypa hystricis (strain UAMH7299) TaxID=1447883 RepID=A0A2B7YJQ3_POLH7|nr:hypothetical protein AJ80_03105 [Polytolypa hystricis UAMH7299]
MAPKGKKTKDSSNANSTTTTRDKQQQQQEQQQVPNWPPLRPLVPSTDLLLEPILQDQIYIIRNLLTSTLCKAYVSFLSTLPLTTTPGKPKRGEAVRVNDRFQVHDPGFAEKLWSSTALRDLVLKGPTSFDEDGEDAQEEDRQVDSATAKELWGGEVLGLNPNIRIYRYVPGQFFAQHYDDSVPLSFSSPPTPARTTWTLLIYLTTCTGGETVFYPGPPPKSANKKKPSAAPRPISVGMEVGMALLHRHGEKCLLHEGREVVSGEKWVIRSDLVIGR